MSGLDLSTLRTRLAERIGERLRDKTSGPENPMRGWIKWERYRADRVADDAIAAFREVFPHLERALARDAAIERTGWDYDGTGTRWEGWNSLLEMLQAISGPGDVGVCDWPSPHQAHVGCAGVQEHTLTHVTMSSGRLTAACACGWWSADQSHAAFERHLRAVQGEAEAHP